MMNEYEAIQKFNFITRALHSTRYKNLKIIVRKISKEQRKLNIVILDVVQQKHMKF